MAKIYTAPQLKNMAVKPDGVKPMVDTYPQLKEVLSIIIIGPDDADKLLRYLAWLYDPESPMVREYPDSKTRKKAAADQSDYKFNKEHLPAHVVFKRDVVQSRLWRALLAKEALFDEFECLLSEAIKTDSVKDADIQAAAIKKDVLSDLLLKIEDQISALKKKFFGDDEELEKTPVQKRKTPETMRDIKK